MKETIVFVHGMSHGAWCWQAHVLPFFRSQGYECLAIDLPGHETAGNTARINHGIEDYLQALEQAVQALPQAPIIVGHSMGGMILQRFLQKKGRCKKALLLASVPSSGVLWPSLRVLFRHPGALKYFVQGNLLGVFQAHPQLMFGDNPEAHQWIPMLCAESFWAYLQLLWPISKFKTAVPMMLMGGDRDALISLSEFQATAQHYGIEFQLLEGASHDLMLEPAPQRYLESMLSWIRA